MALFDPSKLDLAQVVLTEFLSQYPDDRNAKFNLACAHAQLARKGPNAPWDEDHKGETLRLLKELIGDQQPANAWVKRRVKELMDNGQDFQYWKNTPSLQRLLA